MTGSAHHIRSKRLTKTPLPVWAMPHYAYQARRYLNVCERRVSVAQAVDSTHWHIQHRPGNRKARRHHSPSTREPVAAPGEPDLEVGRGNCPAEN